jgi:hypothetical protein
MIHYLRKIRRNLLEKNNFKKYLLYAIGEVLIVMIGILIALQLNNLNQERKNRQDEAYYLSKIKSNLVADVELLTAYIESDKYQIVQLDSLLIILMNPEKYDKKYFTEKIMFLQLLQRFIPTKTTFDNLVASNNLGIIENQELLDNLYSYYNDIESIHIIWDDAFRHYNRNVIVPYFFMNFDYLEYPESRYNYTFGNLIEGRLLTEYAQDVNVLNGIRAQLFFVDKQSEYYSSIIDTAENLINLLSSE